MTLVLYLIRLDFSLPGLGQKRSEAGTDPLKTIVKAIRTLALGDDEELASAYSRFQKAIAREEGIVRNATFVAVNQLQKLSVENNHILVEKTERVEKLLLSMVPSTCLLPKV